MFIKTLVKNLIQSDFRIISNTSIQSIANSEVIGLQKLDGNIFYIINIINADFLKREELDDGISSFTKNITDFSILNNIKNILILNIFVCSDENVIVNDILDSGDEFFSEGVYNVFWSVNLSTKKIQNSKKQPSKVLNIRNIISESFAYDTSLDLNNMSISDIEHISKKTSPVQKKTDKPFISVLIIIINLILLILMELDGGSSTPSVLIKYGAIEPNLIIYNHEYFRLFTSMFLHIGFLHFAFNSLSLYIFGIKVEKYYGHLNYLFIYILSGLFASVTSVLFTHSLAAGASGAIYGIIGAMAAYTFVSKASIEGISFYIIILFIFSGILFGTVDKQIDNFAHFGGLISGFIISYIICKVQIFKKSSTDIKA